MSWQPGHNWKTNSPNANKIPHGFEKSRQDLRNFVHTSGADSCSKLKERQQPRHWTLAMSWFQSRKPASNTIQKNPFRLSVALQVGPLGEGLLAPKWPCRAKVYAQVVWCSSPVSLPRTSPGSNWSAGSETLCRHRLMRHHGLRKLN